MLELDAEEDKDAPGRELAFKGPADEVRRRYEELVKRGTVVDPSLVAEVLDFHPEPPPGQAVC